MKLFLLFFILTWKCIDAHLYPFETPTAKYLKEIQINATCSGLEHIDCIYVINLDERPQKWERVSHLLNQENLFPNRVGAINGWNLPITVQQELAGPYKMRMKSGHVGCLLSHISVILDAYKRGFNCIWIVEDDIEILQNVLQIPQLLTILTQIDPTWDIFYTDIDSKNKAGIRVPSVGSDFRPDQEHIPLEKYITRTLVHQNIMKIGQRFGLYSYIVSKQGIEKILHYFTHVYLWTAIDIDIHYIPNIREYSTTYDLVSVWNGSPISDTILPLDFFQNAL